MMLVQGKHFRTNCVIYQIDAIQGRIDVDVSLSSELKKWIESHPDLERLVLGCIETDFCK